MVVRVLIVDDHAMFRAAARAVLESAGYEVVGEVDRGSHVVAAAGRTRPDVVLLDVGLPDVDGFTVSRRLHQAAPGVLVVLCSVRDAEHYGPRIAGSFAAGFIAKSQLSGAEIARVVDGAAQARSQRK